MNGEDSWREFNKLNLHSGSTPRLGRKEKAQMTGRGQQERRYAVGKLKKFGGILSLGEKSFNSRLKQE